MEMTDNLKQNLYTKQKLKFNSDGNFKIVMMSDLQETLDFDERTMSGIKAILDSEKPDLVVLGGDNCNGLVVKGEENIKKYVEIMSSPLEKRKIPWVHVWGNHDHDVGVDENFHQSVYMNCEHCLSKSAEGVSGQSNFVIPIYSSISDKIKFNVWGLDSGCHIHSFSDDVYGKDSKLYKKALLQNKICEYKTMWGFVTFDKLVWYYNSSCELEEYNGEKIDSLMVTHVAPWEIYNIVHNREECGTVGDAPEKYGLGTFNSGLFSAVLQRKDVRAICSGHSHLNDAAGKYCDIILCTDGSLGYTAYGDNERRGARVFEINENDTSNVKTRMVYCRDLIKQ